MAELQTEIYEASPQAQMIVNQFVNFCVSEGKGNPTAAMALAISVCAQVFMAHGGNLDKGETIGDMVKQGIVTTLQAYKDMQKQTNEGGHA